MGLARILLTVALAASVPSAAWAEPALEGVRNFHRVNDRIFRGGQPTEEGFRNLAKLGVTTVIDLRHVKEHSTTDEAATVQRLGMRYVNVPMPSLKTPRTDQLAKVMELLDSGERVFVHCHQGKDRTGTAIAVYRIERDGWTNARALDEAEQLGMHWYHRGMKRLIRKYTVGDSVASAP